MIQLLNKIKITERKQRKSITTQMGGENVACVANNVHIKEDRCSQIISIMTSAIYQEQRKLAPALRHAFLAVK